VTTSVVVLCYVPGAWLSDCLASVLDQADEVVLVDNASAGGEATRVGRRMGAVVVTSPTNLGYAGGVNLGLRHCSGELVALLNDDAVAGPGWLAAAGSVLADEHVAAVTPRVWRSGWWQVLRYDDPPWCAPPDRRVLGRRLWEVEVDGADALARLEGPGVHRLEEDPGARPARWRWTRPSEPIYLQVPSPESDVVINGERLGTPALRRLNKAGSLLRADGSLGDVGDGEADGPAWQRPGERFFASGTAMVARRDTFARIGGMAEPYFAYYEDADWSWRARLRGMRILYDPTPTVEHRQSATSGGPGAEWVKRTALRNHLLCLTRNGPAPVALAVTRRELGGSDPYGIRPAYRRLLPWALASRAALSRHWQLSPTEVWRRWQGSVDGGPAGGGEELRPRSAGRRLAERAG